MREILFRGKRTDNKEWIFGSLINNIDGAIPVIITMPSVNDGCELEFEYDHVYLDSIGQYTGLTDISGKKIFEGDIVRSYGGIPWLIAFEKNAFVCKDSSMKTYFALWEQWEYNWKSAEDISPSNRFEVIGNFYDNPELLNISK